MTDCEYQVKVHAYHDGELPPADRQSFEVHLKACPACARELERLRRMSDLFASARLPELSPAAFQRLHRSKIVVLQPALVRTSEFFAAAAAAILLVCGAWLWRASTPQELAGMPAWQEVPVTYQVDASTDNDPGAHVAQIILTELR
ncbi:MAG: zf-HC2 domain-containing protein [Candidatus Brocadiia bacterium]|jgi:anti-sigma factor RsiW